MSLLLVVSLGAGAQEDESLQTYLREVMTAEDVESSTWEDVYDQLCELSLHPFDLNTATRSQLEDLPFLSAQPRPHVPNSRTCLSSLPNRSRRSWNTCIAMAR